MLQTDHSPIIIESSQSDSNTNSNIEARNRFGGMRPFKQSISSDDAAARFFLNYVTTAGSSNSFFNPFLKTIYYISTTTGTTTRTTSCIPAGSFTSASSTVACRKRREIFEILLGMHELSDEPVPKAIQEMSPSQVLP